MQAMATPSASAALDLSRLPAFQLVEVDYEAERATLLERVRARLAEQNITFDPSQETDPIVILGEEVAYSRILGLQAINDAGKRMTVAFGYGEALDHVAATYYADVGVRRLAGEDDDRLRRRILLAAEARSPGTLGGYEYWALTFGGKLVDAKALNHASGLVAQGDIAVILVGDPADDGPDGEASQVQAVIAGLLDPDIKLGSDNLVIRAATRTEAVLQAVLEVPPGPDAGLFVAEALKSFDAYRARRKRVGARVPVSALHAALSVAGVDRVRLLSPVADIEPAADGVVEFTSVQITTEASLA